MLRNHSRMLIRCITECEAEERRRRLRVAMDYGVEQDKLDPFIGKVFSYLVESSTNPGTRFVPHYTDVVHAFPALGELPPPTGDIVELSHGVRARYAEGAVDKMLEKYTQQKRMNTLQAVQELHQELGGLLSMRGTHTSVDMDEVWARSFCSRLTQEQETGSAAGVPWPWFPFNNRDISFGPMKPGEMFSIIAVPKSMKTWVGLYIVAFLRKHGYRCLISSQEMRDQEVLARCAAMLAQESYSNIKARKLDVIAFEERLLEAVTAPGMIRFTDARKLDGTKGGISEVQREVERFQPDVVLLDSAYNLAERRNMRELRWESILQVAEGGKAMAQDNGIVVIAIFQENEEQAMYYASKPGARAHAAMADAKKIIQVHDGGIKCVYAPWADQLTLVPLPGRDYQPKLAGITINAIPGVSMDFVSYDLHQFGDVPTPEQVPPTAQTTNSAFDPENPL